ncbi:MAG: hypothetical protein LBH04_11420 [Tannerellaceae bacterium]|jgi:hypothetical protein|nr:hypothetical protein [Tannerellaceae bacterium]
MKHLLFTAIFAALTFNIAAQERLKQEEEIPIVAWWGIQENATSVARFIELKEAGININLAHYSSINAAEKALDAAHKAGVKAMVNCPELFNDTENTVKRLMKHQGLAGYYLKDEPNVKDFPTLSELVRKIQSVDMKHYCYINLFPNTSEWGNNEGMAKHYGIETYKEYVNEFVKQVPVPFVSFDHYPIKLVDNGANRKVDKYWYANLEEIRLCSDRPFWAFALATSHYDYPVPTIAELRLQMFSNLAYGAQGLQYFTYWWPNQDFSHSPIDYDGRRTDVYDRIKQVNREIRNIAGVFLNSKVVSVWHVGQTLLSQTRRIDKLPDWIKVIETGDRRAVVSILEKGARQFLVIVNTSINDAMRLTTVLDDSAKRILKDGTIVPANAYSNTMTVDPGDIMLYMWEK